MMQPFFGHVFGHLGLAKGFRISYSKAAIICKKKERPPWKTWRIKLYTAHFVGCWLDVHQRHKLNKNEAEIDFCLKHLQNAAEEMRATCLKLVQATSFSSQLLRLVGTTWTKQDLWSKEAQSWSMLAPAHNAHLPKFGNACPPGNG